MTQTDPYATGVLKKEHHDRLVADLVNYANDAGIRPHWIWTALPEDVTSTETNYLTKFRHHGATGACAGLCYVGPDIGIAERMAAVAGCLVRNFVRARVMTLGTVNRMRDCFEWITFLDNGTGGDAGRDKIWKTMANDHVVHHIVPPPGRKDPGVCAVEEIAELLKSLVKLDEIIS